MASETQPFILGLTGETLRLADLPTSAIKRWSARRKAEVVSAVRGRYDLSIEEFLSWERLAQEHGLRGLQTTRVQEYRS